MVQYSIGGSIGVGFVDEAYCDFSTREGYFTVPALVVQIRQYSIGGSLGAGYVADSFNDSATREAYTVSMNIPGSMTSYFSIGGSLGAAYVFAPDRDLAIREGYVSLGGV